MEYTVIITLQATEQIREIAAYIARTLQEPEIARHWVNRLEREISELRFLPLRYPSTEEEPWHTGGIRKMTVKNFLVYYRVEEESKTVSVLAVLYGRRDQLAALTNGE